MTAALNPADLYHAGIVVDDIDVAMQRLTEAGGYRWTQTMSHTVPVVTADGPLDMPFTLVYSVEAPHLELVGAVPGTIWAANPRNAVHHLGYWTDDVEATGARLEQAGYSLEVRPGADLPMMFAYYLDPLGVRIELVNRTNFGDWPGFVAAMAR